MARLEDLCPICHDPLCAASAIGITEVQRHRVIALVHSQRERDMLLVTKAIEHMHKRFEDKYAYDPEKKP
jgi:hypothetical protein